MPWLTTPPVPSLHYLLEKALTEGPDHLSLEFLVGVENMADFDTNPIYAILHESIYMESTRKSDKVFDASLPRCTASLARYTV